MKKAIVLAALLTAATIPAHAGIHFSIGIGLPAPARVIVAPAPVYVPAPAPVVVAPAPFYAPPPAVVYAPPRVVYGPPPAMVVAPAPVFVRPPGVYFRAGPRYVHPHHHFRGPRHGCR